MDLKKGAKRSILLGFYLGIGDFLSAVPTFQRLTTAGHQLTIVASPANLQLVDLIDLEKGAVNWIRFEQFSRKSLFETGQLYRRLLRLTPDLAFFSPHAVAGVSSWKLPLLLRMLRLTVWRHCQVIGAEGQRMSHMFDRQVPVDFSRGLVDREWMIHQQADTIPKSESPDGAVFRPEITERESLYDLVVHPGASRDNKRWPVSHYVDLVRRLDRRTRMAFVGLPSELAPIEAETGDMMNVEWISGSLSKAIETLAAGRMVLTMDSGFAHVAALLNRPHVAVFGSTDPALFAPRARSTRVLYERKLDCQPCNSHDCPIKGIPCMKTVGVDRVIEEIARIAEVSMPG